jgi:hypothetical protein
MHETLGTNNNQKRYINFVKTVIRIYVAWQKELHISVDPDYMMQHCTICKFKHTSVWQKLLLQMLYDYKCKTANRGYRVTQKYEHMSLETCLLQ